MRRSKLIFSFVLLICAVNAHAQSLQVVLSPDKSKINRSTKNGIATIFFESDIEDLRIINADEDQKEQINKVNDNLWYINIDVNSDLKQDGACYRHFLLKSTSSGEYDLTTDDILPNQVLYYNVFLPKIASGEPLRINVKCDMGFENGGFPENLMGLLSTLPYYRQGKGGADTLTIYRNLKNNTYSQIYTTKLQDIINNINTGDVLTFIPNHQFYEQISVTVSDSVIKNKELTITLHKKRIPLQGYVIDNYTQKPVQGCRMRLYLGNADDRHRNPLGYKRDYSSLGLSDLGYKKYFEFGENIGEYITNSNGYFGWGNCVIDYSYYIRAYPPKGYYSIGPNKGSDIKPIDINSDSLIIRITPTVIKGVVTFRNLGVSNATIEYETLYGKKIQTTAIDGSFEIVGLTSECVRISHKDYREMYIKFDDSFLVNYGDPLVCTIPMKKMNNKLFIGEYKYGKIIELK